MTRIITLIACFSFIISCSNDNDETSKQTAAQDRTEIRTSSDQQAENAHPSPEQMHSVKDYSAVKVAPATFVIHGPAELPTPENKGFMNNPAFIIGSDGVIVIDPGSSVYVGEMVLREIGNYTDKPVVAIFDTHIHGDHWLANDAFKKRYPDVAIYGHEKMIALVEEGVGQDWIDLMLQLTEGATDGTEIVKPNMTAEDGQRITIADQHFDIIHNGTAHTETDIMIHYVQGDVLFTGDNAGNQRVLRLSDGSFRGNADVLQLGLDRNPAVVVPGHGPSGDASILSMYRDYLQTIYDEVAIGYEEDLSDFEMKPAVHEKLSAYHGWSGYEEELGKQISEAYLEIESADF